MYVHLTIALYFNVMLQKKCIMKSRYYVKGYKVPNVNDVFPKTDLNCLIIIGISDTILGLRDKQNHPIKTQPCHATRGKLNTITTRPV